LASTGQGVHASPPASGFGARGFGAAAPTTGGFGSFGLQPAPAAPAAPFGSGFGGGAFGLATGFVAANTNAAVGSGFRHAIPPGYAQAGPASVHGTPGSFLSTQQQHPGFHTAVPPTPSFAGAAPTITLARKGTLAGAAKDDDIDLDSDVAADGSSAAPTAAEEPFEFTIVPIPPLPVPDRGAAAWAGTGPFQLGQVPMCVPK
jgi:hypothetical protein